MILSRNVGRHKGSDTEVEIMSVLVNGRQFLSGLYWKPISSARAYMSEARAIGKKHGWDVVAIRKGERIQAGFVARNSGATKGMYSLAAALAGILGTTWIGAFAVVDGRYAVIAVRDGSIIPGFDLIVDGDKAIELVKQAYNLYPKGDTVEVYVPASFNFGGKELQIADLLESKNLKSQYRLRPLSFPIERLLLFVALVGVGYAGWNEYTTYQRGEALKIEAQMERERAAELAKLNARAKVAQQAKALEHPWAKTPSALDIAARCVAQIHSVPLSLGGWLVETAKCEGDQLTVEFRRLGGTVGDFKGAALDIFEMPIITDNGEKATVKRAIEPLQLAGDDPLQDADEIQTRVVSRLQTLGMQYDMTEKAVVLPEMAPIPGDPPALPPQATWRHFPFRFTAILNPALVIKGMAPLDGIRLSSISVQISTEGLVSWTATGDIYARK